MQCSLTLSLAVAMLAMAASGCSSPDVEAATDQDPVTVNAVVAEQSRLRRTTSQPATVHAYHTANIHAKVSGYVRETPVDIGDRVNQGDVLAVIDVPEFEKQLAVAEARIARGGAQEVRAAAGLALAKANLADAEAGIAEVESQIAAATARQKAAEAEFERTETLVSQQSVEQKLLDEARERRDAAEADVDATRAALTKAQSQVAVAEAAVSAAEAELQSARADVAVAKAQRDEIQVMLDFGTLRAPFDGVVTYRGVDPGDLVRSAGQTGDSVDQHFIVTQLDKVRVRTTVPETDAPLVDVGDPVSIKLASPEFPVVEGAVTRTSSSLDPSTRTMTVEIEVANPAGKLLPGMYGEATITLVEKPDAVMLPASAVRFTETGESFVYVISDGDTVHVVDVSLGYDNGERIEIASSLAAGQRVIDAHLKRFQNGDAVRVLE